VNKLLSAIGAATSGVLLVSTSALAFCFNEKSYNGGTDTVSCNANGDSGSNRVERPGGGLNYTYRVSGSSIEDSVGGVLLDSTASVIHGDEGPCNRSIRPIIGGSKTFTCTNADASVAFIRVFAE
jgi:hypothetical protein